MSASDNGIIVRTIVDLPEPERDQLDALCHQRGMSRAEALRQALLHWLAQQQPSHRGKRRPLTKVSRAQLRPSQRRIRPLARPAHRCTGAAACPAGRMEQALMLLLDTNILIDA